MSNRIVGMLVFAGLLAAPAAQASAVKTNSMDEYDMESGTSVNDDLFGFGINSTVWHGIQLTFTNVTFADAPGKTFSLLGFDIFEGGTNAGGGTKIGTTTACAGIVTPLPAAQTTLTCDVPLGVVLSGTPYFVFPVAGSAGIMRKTVPGSDATVELQGIPGTPTSTVPEPSALALMGMAVAALGFRRPRLSRD